MDIKNNPQKMQENAPRWASNPLPALLRRYWRWAMVAVAAVLVITAGTLWLAAQDNPTRQIGPNSADPAYIVVNTPTAVTFTSVIADSNLKKQDPKKVLLIRTDAAGTPVDIIGRMNDLGKTTDASKDDHTYTIQATLNEPAVGPVSFRIAAKFKETLTGERDPDGDDDWDGLLLGLQSAKKQKDRGDRLSQLLRKLGRYALSDSVVVTAVPIPTVDTPIANPPVIGINMQTQLTVTALVGTPLVPTDVQLLRTDATGEAIAILGQMYDDGTHGDALVGDKTFSLTFAVNEPATGPIYLRVSALFKNQAERSLSEIVTLVISSPTGTSISTVGSNSQLVILGTVTSTQASAGPVGIFTDAIVTPIRILKGTVPNGPVLVIVPAGTLGDITYGNPSLPVFKAGDEVVLFLEGPNSRNAYRLSSGGFAAFKVVVNGRGDSMAVAAGNYNLFDPAEPLDPIFGSLLQRSERGDLTLQQLLETIALSVR